MSRLSNAKIHVERAVKVGGTPGDLERALRVAHPASLNYFITYLKNKTPKTLIPSFFKYLLIF